MPGEGRMSRAAHYRKRAARVAGRPVTRQLTRSLIETSAGRKSSSRSSRCQSAPYVMDSLSSSASSPWEAPRPQHRPPSPPPHAAPSPIPASSAPASTPPAFDNAAYQHDEDLNHNGSFTSSNGQTTREPNGTSTSPEAVNLELINLQPKNGIKKKDVEVEVHSNSNPYDEYFVPVNEHRKYMRGEKLYVTADKRGEKGGCKRPLCWTLLALVVAAVIALIVLAATGILFTNAPTPLYQYNSSLTSARALGGFGSNHDHSAHDHDDQSAHDHNDHSVHDHSGHESSEEQDMAGLAAPSKTTESSIPIAEPTTTENTVIPKLMVSEESAESNTYVPRTLEGKLTVDNEEFIEAYYDSESDEFITFNENFSSQLRKAILEKNHLDLGPFDFKIEVISIKPGSLIVTYRIHWTPKSTSSAEATTGDPLTVKSLNDTLKTYLQKNNGMLNVYHIAEDKMVTGHVLDFCQINKNNCEYGCEFEETTLDFVCSCPRGMILDINNSKKCMSYLESDHNTSHEETTKQKEYRVLNFDGTEATPRITSEEEKATANFDWKSMEETLKTTTEASVESQFSYIFGTTKETEHIAESIPEPQPEPNSETETEAKLANSSKDRSPESEPTQQKPNPAHESAVKLLTNLEPSSNPEPNPAPEPNLASEPTASPGPNPAPEPNPVPEPNPAPEPNSGREPSPESEPNLGPKPTPEPEPQINPELHLNVKSRPGSEATVQPISEDSQKDQFRRNTVNSETTKPLLWRYKPVTEEVLVPSTTLKTSESAETELSAEIERSAETEQRQSSNEDSNLFKHLNMYAEKHMETTNQKVSINETSQVQEEVMPEVFSIYERHETNDSRPIFDDMTLKTSEINTEQPFVSTVLTNVNIADIFADPQKSTDMFTPSKMTTEKPTAATIKVSEGDEDITFDLIARAESYNPSTVLTYETETTDQPTTSTPGIEMVLGTDRVSSGHEQENSLSNMLTNIENTRLSEVIAQEPVSMSTQEPVSITTDNIKETISSSDDFVKILNSAIEEATFSNATTTELPPTTKKTTTTTTKTTTMVPETTTIFHLKNDLNNTQQSASVMEFLENNTYPILISTTEKVIEKEISFDAINAFYNRTSKSIDKNTANATADVTTEGPFATVTSDSDWLNEAVSEIKFDKMMGIDTTTKSIEISQKNLDLTKFSDDIEPDYLIINTTPEPDIPLYAMVHDYDSDDSRVKRVNSDIKESSTVEVNSTSLATTTIKTVNLSDSNTLKSNEKVKSETTTTEIEENKHIETTTVTQYIYKGIDKRNESLQTNNVSITLQEKEPAPVWEKDQTEDSQSESTATLEAETFKVANTTYHNNSMQSESNTGNTTEIQHQNVPQVNNLNVTIYEIPDNESVSVPKSVTHSGEYVDHETEMNPFLPETENNKSLVKKLQEGHDLELASVNETQNENMEEHSNSSSISPDKDISTKEQGRPQDETSYNDLTENYNSPEVEGNTNNKAEDKQEIGNNLRSKTQEKGIAVSSYKAEDKQEIGKTFGSKTQEKGMPVSKFLKDTDDLEVSKETTTQSSNAELEKNTDTVLSINKATEKAQPEPDSTQVSTDTLSVVPISEERRDTKDQLKKVLKSGSVSELNDISDSPKKSDRRTLDASRLDSVINNEA